MLRTLLLALVLLAGPAFAQQGALPAAIPYAQAEALGVDIALLDSTHTPAVSTDPAPSAFPGRQADVVEAWRTYVSGLSAHLRDGGFEWAEPLRGVYRFYFKPDGQAEVVTYHVPTLSEEQANAFGRLLGEYVETSAFALASDVPFAQCGPVTLLPPSGPDR